MRRSSGYAVISDPQAAVPQFEWDTASCGHCQRVIFTKPGSAQTVYVFPQADGSAKEEMGAGCRVCMRPVCLQCCEIGICQPWETQVELMEAAGRLGLR